MNLLALPAFADNYIWMMHDGERAVVVDPGDAAPVVQALARLGLALDAILLTHHHADHVGGVAALRPKLKGRVYGPAREDLPQPCTPLQEGDTVNVLGSDFGVLDVPGHTRGHIAYWQQAAARDDDDAAPLLFCGDTLFSAGCGRLLGGTAPQLHQSLQRLAALPPDTQVCCTHEYTLANLRFAAAVEPDNPVRAMHTAACEARRARGEPTLPSTLGLELQINPFLRCQQPAVIQAAMAQGADAADAVSVFAALRAWKDRFR